MDRPRLGVFKLTSCDGCQLTLLDLEDELLAIAAGLEIVCFTELTSASDPRGPFDVVLVEGSISTPEQREQIQEIRARTPVLIAIGACASAGGLQALRNFADHAEFVRAVYARPDHIASLATSTPISAHVPVDLELRGCPIDKGQLRELVTALLAGRRPNLPTQSVCMQCKAAGQVCVTVARGVPCLGPVTQAGCGALCPRFARGCYGCFGPYAGGSPPALSRRLAVLGQSRAEIQRAFRFINGWAEAFRAEGDRHD
ncbi:MAG: oxidoreductase [Myxococcales bacterium]|nr:oxidoreductase [Myxococcales bacterium]